MINTDVISISIRHLKMVLCLCEARITKRAAHMLGRSRTAVSKAVLDVEKQLGVKIFERTSAGYIPTQEGEMLITRVRVITQLFDDLARSYQKAHLRPKNINTIPFFTMDIATKRLWQLSLLHDTESIVRAAHIAGQSVSTIYKSVHELEQHLDMPLFARLPNSRFIPVEFGEQLCRQVKLVLSELGHALEDIRSIKGAVDGRVSIGCLPSMRPFLLPATLVRLRKAHPELSIRIDAGPYTAMSQALLRGDLDVIIGGTRSSLISQELVTEELVDDRVCIVAGAGHPLTKVKRLTKRHFKSAQWVMPLSGTPSREIFDNCLRTAGVSIDGNCIETGSTTALRGILLSNDVLSIGTVFQTYHERSTGHLTVLPFKLGDDAWPLGLTLRRVTPPSLSLQYFIDHLRATVQELEPTSEIS